MSVTDIQREIRIRLGTADDFDLWTDEMNWVVRYRLDCGCLTPRVYTTEKSKRDTGQTWECPLHGVREIVGLTGVTQ